MRRARYGVAAVLGLAALVAGNWWLNRVFEAEPPPPPVVDSRIDYALRDFTAAFFDTEGRQTLRVSGPALAHDALTLEARIESPTFELEPGEGEWSGRADRGIVERDVQRLTLIGNVTMTRPDRRGPLRVASERVIYERPGNVARSPGPARVEQAGDLLTGGSLEIWIDEERVELTDDVHAIYRGAGAAADG